MPIKEEAEVTYVTINGKKVPQVKCETEIVLRNTKTGVEYNSEEEAEQDINSMDTPTKREDVTRSVKIKVAKMPTLGAASKL